MVIFQQNICTISIKYINLHIKKTLNMKKIIARKEEIKELERLYQSDRSELVIVFGRRRIGKTFLINHLFGDRFTYTFVGVRGQSQKHQLEMFARQLQAYSGSTFTPNPQTWDEAFYLLRDLINAKPKQERKVIFFDEMPWIDRPRSNFVAAFEYFWNAWAAQRDDIFFIACGSATSWMVDKLVKNKGGLYNRITGRIYLRPFNLSECEEYLHAHDCTWDRYTILQCYMAMGGVPYYLSQINPQQSLAQNIDRLFFTKNSIMSNEFDELFTALFNKAEHYIEVIKMMAEKREGFLRSEISEKTKLTGSHLTHILENLERCDFIMTYQKYKSKKRNMIYRISDPYILFYFKFIKNYDYKDPQFWSHNLMSPSLSSWQGFSFEMLCLLHLQQIKKALGISGIATYSTAWRKTGDTDQKGAQIDLLIERADRFINLCEIKFCSGAYNITKQYEDKLREKMRIFRDDTHTTKPLLLTMVTTFGVARGIHSGIVTNEVLMDSLFENDK